jgi:hypothetical protein
MVVAKSSRQSLVAVGPGPRETHMKSKVDIFKKLPDGHMIWVRAVENLDEARVQLKRLEYINPGQYFIYDNRFGGVEPSFTAEPAIFVH